MFSSVLTIGVGRMIAQKPISCVVDSENVCWTMGPRDTLTETCIRRSWSSCHPHSLVWLYSSIGTIWEFARNARVSPESSAPQLPWRRLIPPTFYDFWIQCLRVMCNGNSTLDEKDEAIHRTRNMLPADLGTDVNHQVLNCADIGSSSVRRSFLTCYVPWLFFAIQCIALNFQLRWRKLILYPASRTP